MMKNTRFPLLRHARSPRVRALGVLLTVGATLGCWCGTATAAPNHIRRASAGIHLVTATPAPGGRLSSITWDLPLGQPLSLDYVKDLSYSTTLMLEDVCTNLLRYSPSFQLEPSLAKSWKYTNSTTLVFTIRRGVHFWNGQELTSADVVYSLLRNMTKKNEPVHGYVYSSVKSITATGQFQVTVHFTKPDELFVKYMGEEAGAVAEKSYIEAKGSSYGTPSGGVMCTGAFVLTKWSTGSDIVLKANPNYWTPTYRPRTKKITVKFITTASALTSALLTGEITGAYEVPSSSYEELMKASDGTLYFGPSFDVTGIGPMTPSGPMSKTAKLREALSLAITRTALVKVIYDGAAVPLKALTPVTAFAGLTDTVKAYYEAAYAKLPSLNRNLAEARKLVKSAPDRSATIKMASLAGTENQVQLATAVESAAQAIGLNLKIDELQTTTYLDAVTEPKYQKGLDLFQGGGAFTVPDPLDYYTDFVGKTAVYNWGHLVNPAVTSEVTEALSTIGNAARARLVAKAQAGFMKVASYIPLLNADEALFMNKRITGAPVSFAYLSEPSLATLGASK